MQMICRFSVLVERPNEANPITSKVIRVNDRFCLHLTMCNAIDFCFSFVLFLSIRGNEHHEEINEDMQERKVKVPIFRVFKREFKQWASDGTPFEQQRARKKTIINFSDLFVEFVSLLGYCDSTCTLHTAANVFNDVSRKERNAFVVAGVLLALEVNIDCTAIFIFDDLRLLFFRSLLLPLLC